MSGNIYIPKPCHENWNKMTPEEQGRHCGACNKVVKDFTKMKTEEIVDTLKKTQGEVCGRIGVQQLTPTNSKQKIWFWMNGFLYRKAIYPVMALLGISFISKKVQAQVGHDYPLKGKMEVRNYHTSNKKINIVVKTADGNSPVSNATVTIVSGVVKQSQPVKTDGSGRVTLTINPEDLLSKEIEIEISAVDYALKTSTITITKDIQTVEIRMDYELMIMGEMMYVPEELPVEKINSSVQDSLSNIEVCKCDFNEITKLPVIATQEYLFNTESEDNDTVSERIDDNIIREEEVGFILFPNPSADFITIQSSGAQNFGVDVLDGNGKRIHAIANIKEKYLLDLTKYAAGTYYAIITVDGKMVETKKIIVTR